MAYLFPSVEWFAKKPEFVITGTLDTYRQIFSRKLDPIQALMTRRLELQGNMGVYHRPRPMPMFGPAQVAVGVDSAWAAAFRQAAGFEAATPLERAAAGLRLYRETTALIAPIVRAEHRPVIEATLARIRDVDLGQAGRPRSEIGLSRV